MTSANDVPPGPLRPAQNGLITRRSQVQILPPPPIRKPGNNAFPGFRRSRTSADNWPRCTEHVPRRRELPGDHRRRSPLSATHSEGLSGSSTPVGPLRRSDYPKVARRTPYMSVSTTKDQLIDIAGLAERLCVGERFVRRLVNEHRVPFPQDRPACALPGRRCRGVDPWQPDRTRPAVDSASGKDLAVVVSGVG